MTNSNNSKLLVASTAAALTVGVAAATYWWHQQKCEQPRNLHVAVPPVHLPLAMRVLPAVLPAAMRRAMILKQANPKPPLDGVDVLGHDYNPYTELGHEIVPNKLWRVRYRSIQSPDRDAALKTIGLDMDDLALLQGVPDALLRQNMEQAMLDRAAMNATNKGLSKEEQLRNLARAGCEDSQDMMVVRLDNGGLLLYNPVRMHPRLMDWLSKLGGEVEWIVSGSSVHTNQLPQAANAYPDAKILCAQAANEKCQTVGMRPSDYIYTDPEGIQKASQALGSTIRLVHLKGDVMSQNLFVIAYHHLLEVDLACYGNGTRLLTVDKKDWEQPSNNNPICKSVAFGQLFYGLTMVPAFQAGYLPNFRIWGMDPTSIFSKWSLDEPNPDGSSCVEFAQSLRKLLADTDFSFVDSAHSLRRASIPADEFKQAVNGMWNWLDGSSLLAQ